MTRSITTVKREVRILGLDFCGAQEVLGAVVRGGLYLDGVISFSQKRNYDSERVADRILGTRYFPELRSVMVHGARSKLDLLTIEKMTRLPVIEVSRVKPREEKGYRVFHRAKGTLWAKTSLPLAILERILSLTWTTGLLPEPIRVAHILAKTSIPKTPL